VSRKKQIFSAIIVMTKEKGYPPSFREIGNRVGLKSSSSVSRYLELMRKDGAVDWEEGSPRTLRVIAEMSDVS
jgi:SOS-response transcriptional repressor LexA